jgi:tripartite-type tricarboxylate transporter receptor subunit TctC
MNLKLARRKFLHLTAGAVALPALSRIARADTYPARPVRILVGFAAGGGADISARTSGQWLTERLGQQFIVEDRPGAGSNIATEAVVRAPPDGYTLLEVTVANAISAALYDKLSFNFIRDIAPVAAISQGAMIMVVNPSFPAKTVAEFIAYAKANPGKINMATSGSGTGPQVAGELFKMMAGIEMTQVPYRGGAPAITAVVSGQVQVFFSPLPEPIEQIKAGNLRALAISTASRWQGFPDLPTIGEFVPGYEASTFYGVGAPNNTPTEIIEKLNKEINAGLADAKMKARIADMGGTVVPGPPANFAKFIAAETEKWAKVVKFAGLKPE